MNGSVRMMGLVALLALILATTAVGAQVSAGGLRGTVYDLTRAGIPDVAVTIRND